MHEAQKIAEDVAYRIVYHTRDFFTIRSVTLSFSVAGVQKKKKKNREMKRNKDFRYDIHFFLSITFTNNTIKKKKRKEKENNYKRKRDVFPYRRSSTETYKSLSSR